jgi:nitroimidazol reductase NimA-like FMN-containing flavoprotein (pyridoxamine 5'-phosphate oxidase superfamily)
MVADGLRDLPDSACLQLLRRRRLGRVGLTVETVPHIFPVNYGLLDDEVVFRTAPGTKMLAAILERAVAFETDSTTADIRAGWSVLIVGHATRIVYAPLLERAHQLELQPWAPGDRDYYIKITTDRITGRSYGHIALD